MFKPRFPLHLSVSREEKKYTFWKLTLYLLYTNNTTVYCKFLKFCRKFFEINAR